MLKELSDNDKNKRFNCPHLSYHLAFILGQEKSIESLQNINNIVAMHLEDEEGNPLCKIISSNDTVSLLNAYISKASNLEREIESLKRKLEELTQRKNAVVMQLFKERTGKCQ